MITAKPVRALAVVPDSGPRTKAIVATAMDAARNGAMANSGIALGGCGAMPAKRLASITSCKMIKVPREARRHGFSFHFQQFLNVKNFTLVEYVKEFTVMRK